MNTGAIPFAALALIMAIVVVTMRKRLVRASERWNGKPEPTQEQVDRRSRVAFFGAAFMLTLAVLALFVVD